MEYDPMAELGLVAEKQFVCSNHGFVTRTNGTRDLCARFIRNGDRVYDAFSRYDTVTSYALSREGGNPGGVTKLLVPFLKAWGILDNSAYEYSRDVTELMPGADHALRYILSQMPAYMTTGSYEHHIMNVSDMTEFPLNNISFNLIAFDKLEISRQDAKILKNITTEISNLRVSDEAYTVTENKYLNKDDSKLVDYFDDMIEKELSKMEIYETVKKMTMIGANEKAYAVLELCRKNDIEMSDTVMVGSDNSDYQAMDLVRDSGGLALAFNGAEYAIRGANVAVLSKKPIVATVLVTEFYNGGIESVYNLINNWTKEGLQTVPCADRNLMNRMLEEFPKKLPEVYIVEEDNINDIVTTSAEYRKHIFH